MDNHNVTDNVFFISSPNKGVFYYTSAVPSAVNNEKKHPNISYNVYQNNSANKQQFYATLSIEAELSISVEQAKAAAKKNSSIPADTTLLPLQVISSKATLSIPGVNQTCRITASLGNNNLSVTQLSFTDKNQIEILDALLKKPETAPIALIYQQDYLLQVPPSTFELQANWASVYTYIEKKYGFNIILFSIDITNISQTLIEDKMVTIKTRDTLPDSHIEEAGKELTNILLAEFFQPVLSNKIPADNKPSFGFILNKKISLVENNNRTLSARIDSTTVVKRSFFPQALFAQLVENSHYDADKVITQKNIDDNFFTQRKVKISLLNPVLEPGISLVTVVLKYNGQTKSFSFNADNLTDKNFSVDSEITGASGSIIWPVDYSYTLYFTESINGISHVSSENRSTTLEQLFIDVNALYQLYTFNIKTVNSFNWDWYKSVIVTIDSGTLQQPNHTFSQTYLFDKKMCTAQLTLSLPKPEQFSFSTKLKYVVNDNSPHLPVVITQPSAQDTYLYSTVYPQRKLLLKASYDWTIIKQVLVHLSYNCHKPNETKPLNLIQNLIFNKKNTVQFFSADQLYPDVKSIDLNLIITDQDNKIIPKYYTTTEDQLELTDI
ncbi:hypothetical protein AADZ91_02900 [Colwelliaceae bacterium 6441]